MEYMDIQEIELLQHFADHAAARMPPLSSLTHHPSYITLV